MRGTVSVVIVSYNGRTLLEPCLRALFAGTRLPDEVIVVDNASTDGTIPWLAKTYPSVRVIAAAMNLGFASANNRGIVASTGDYLFTLNNDTEVAPEVVERLTTALDSGDARLGAAMSTMVFQHHPTVVASMGLEVLANGVVRDVGVGEASDPGVPSYPVFGPSAGAALYRRVALDDVGFFDPAFFMYLEDADLAWRLRLRRWETIVLPNARVTHAVSRTAGYGSPRKAYYLARNRWWCLLKNLPSPLLREHAGSIARYDAAAAAFAFATADRASLTGRWDALSERATIRRARRSVQARRTASLDELRAWILPAPPLVATLQERHVMTQMIEES